MSKIFFFSGLGANELAFSKIGDLDYPKIMVGWIKNHKNESLNSYAKRLIEIYKIKSSDYLAGLSFGGLIAQEIANILGNSSVILISSFRDKSDLKFVFKFALNLRIHQIFPMIKIPIIEEIIANILNSGSADSKKVLKEMIKTTDYRLMNWSINKIAESKFDPNSNITLFNILGNKDRILSRWSNPNSFIIDGGSHFMVYDKADELTEILAEILKKSETNN